MDYIAINAKIKAMRGKLLKQDDYDMLCTIKSVPEFGLTLKNNPVYKECLQSISEFDIHREPIEQKIVTGLHGDFSRIYKFIGDYRIKKFLDCFFLKNEIRVLKMMLCMVYDERDITYLLPDLSGLSKNRWRHVDTTGLKSANTVPEFIAMLEGTEFHRVLANVYDEKTTLFQLEVQLDLYYFFQLWKAKHLYLNKLNEKLVDSLIGMEIDMQNIIWIYRLKTFYNVPSALIYTYLIPMHFKLNKEHVNRMVESENTDILREEISSGPYGRVFAGFDNIEAAVYNEMCVQYRGFGIKHPDSLALTLSYIFLKELEIKNLISILEGIRYSLEPNDILKLVIVKRKAEAG